jgi:hypothetical protein
VAGVATSVECSDQSADSLLSQPDLEGILREALKRRREYVDFFKNLTADETKITEVFDENGELKKRRKQLSYFLVYESPFNDHAVNEYRFTREVDGKRVKNEFERVEKLFGQLAGAKTLESEWNRLREENLRHTLKYYRWDITLHPAAQLEDKCWPEYSYEVVRHEKLDGRETLLLLYRRKTLYAAKAEGILSQFKDPHIGDRGRIWLDARTFELCGWENEWVVRHPETGSVLVYLRDEVSYAQSEMGFFVPDRIVVSFFDKLRYKRGQKAEPRTCIGGRITYTYESFRRFKVTSQE